MQIYSLQYNRNNWETYYSSSIILLVHGIEYKISLLKYKWTLHRFTILMSGGVAACAALVAAGQPGVVSVAGRYLATDLCCSLPVVMGGQQEVRFTAQQSARMMKWNKSVAEAGRVVAQQRGSVSPAERIDSLPLYGFGAAPAWPATWTGNHYCPGLLDGCDRKFLCELSARFHFEQTHRYNCSVLKLVD